MSLQHTACIDRPMSIPKISEATIRLNATAQSFERGEAYYQSDCVVSLTRRGNLLQAEVEGSEVQPYRVNLSFDEGGFTETHCTCPYDYDGWCKHIVAALLVCQRQPEIIEERPTLKQLLDRLELVQIQSLLQSLVEEHPELIDEIDSHVSLMTAPTPSKQTAKSPRRTTSVDPAPFRQQVRQILRNAARSLEEGYEEEDPITEEIQEIIQKAQGFTEQEDGNNALVILQAIVEACIKDWEDVEEYGAENYEVVLALNEAFTEAILSAELTREEKVDLRVNLESWQDEWSADFNMSLAALSQDWDYPPLQQILQGNITQRGVWEGQTPDFADELALIRLQILDRQERYQEYLYLAEAEGQTKQYLTMLGRLGRVEEAMTAAKTQMESMEEAFALAQTLRSQGSLAQALEIAQNGLNLPGNCQYDLASWTSDLAEGLGDRTSALNARAIAFKAMPSFGDYRKVEELAGESWSTVKLELLNALRDGKNWGLSEAKVDIFLHEGLIDDAIAAVSNLSSYESAQIHRVMKEAIAYRPDWVIENAIPRAEDIIEPGKAEYYDRAVEWLKKARAAYLETGRRSEWSAYRANLMKTHARKHKLMGLMKHRDLE